MNNYGTFDEKYEERGKKRELSQQLEKEEVVKMKKKKIKIRFFTFYLIVKSKTFQQNKITTGNE